MDGREVAMDAYWRTFCYADGSFAGPVSLLRKGSNDLRHILLLFHSPTHSPPFRERTGSPLTARGAVVIEPLFLQESSEESHGEQKMIDSSYLSLSSSSNEGYYIF